MSGSGQGPKLGKVVGNGLRMVARGCQRSPEVPAGLKWCLQTVPGPGKAARGQFRRNRGSPHLINTGVGGMAQPFNFLQFLYKIANLLAQTHHAIVLSHVASVQIAIPLGLQNIAHDCEVWMSPK